MAAKVEKWDVFEARFKGPQTGNPFLDVDFTVVFTRGNRTVPISGFYDGDGEYVVRFMPDSEGCWTFRTTSNVKALEAKSGSFECIAPSQGNHGPVSVDKYHHFRYADGTFYSCIGTTAYAWIHHGDANARKTLATLKKSPFNKIRMFVFPMSYPNCEHDDPELYPFPLLKKGGTTWDGHWESKGGTVKWRFDFGRFDTRFFRMLDERILQLKELNVEADVIVLSHYDRWGFATLEHEVEQRFLRYVIARIGANRNVWWSVINEWDFNHHKTVEQYETVGRTIAESDPYHRLVGIHNAHKWFDHSRPWITHCSIQTNQFQIPKWRDEYRKPIVIDEMCYEGTISYDYGNLNALELTHRFWLVALTGGYPGHSECFQRPDNAMWFNRGGVLRGESPARIAFLRKLMESGPDMGIEPYPKWMYEMYCGCKGERWILCYTGIRQPVEIMARLPKGKRYRLTHIDPWGMTMRKTRTIIKGAGESEVAIPLTGKPYQASLLEMLG